MSKAKKPDRSNRTTEPEKGTDDLPVFYSTSFRDGTAVPHYYVPDRAEAEGMKEFGDFVKKEADRRGAKVTQVDLNIGPTHYYSALSVLPVKRTARDKPGRPSKRMTEIGISRDELLEGNYKSLAGQVVIGHEFGHLEAYDSEVQHILECLQEQAGQLEFLAQKADNLACPLAHAAAFEEEAKNQKRALIIMKGIQEYNNSLDDDLQKLKKSELWARREKPAELRDYLVKHPDEREAFIDMALRLNTSIADRYEVAAVIGKLMPHFDKDMTIKPVGSGMWPDERLAYYKHLKEALEGFATEVNQESLEKDLARFRHSYRRVSEYLRDKDGLETMQGDKRAGLAEFEQFLRQKRTLPTNPDNPKKKPKKYHPSTRLRAAFGARMLDELETREADGQPEFREKYARTDSTAKTER